MNKCFYIEMLLISFLQSKTEKCLLVNHTLTPLTMKKLFTKFFVPAIICVSISMVKAQSPRLQLFEYFDNTSIPPFGAVANAHFDSLADANTDKIIFIKYHVAWGSETGTDPMNLQNPDQAATRVLYYLL